MARFARLKDLVGVLVLIALAVLVLLGAGPALAYGEAGGATHTADCYSNASSIYPSYGGCATSVGAIRDADMQKYLADLKAATPTYNFEFQAWNVCPTTFPGQSGSCSFYYIKTAVSSGVRQLGNNGGVAYIRQVSQTADCVGAGYQIVGLKCVCAPGYAPNATGGCDPHECPDPGVIPGTDGKGWGWYNMDSGGNAVCFDGCLITGSYGVGYEHKWFILGPFYNTGQKCNPSDEGGTYPPAGEPGSGPPTPTDAPKCGVGQCPGTVNGTEVCVACDTTSTGGYSGNGNGGKWTQTNCSNGTCWTQSGDIDPNGNAKPPDGWDVGSGGGNPQANPGGGSGSCSGSDCQSQDKFCEENPESIICKSSTWGGSCSGSFACSGDAVQCAMAKEQHERNCVLFDTETELSQKGRDAANGEAQPDGHPFKNASETSISFSEKIDMTNRLVGSCPAGRSVTVAGVQLVIVTDGLCNALEMVGNIIVALGALAALFIVFKG